MTMNLYGFTIDLSIALENTKRCWNKTMAIGEHDSMSGAATRTRPASNRSEQVCRPLFDEAIKDYTKGERAAFYSGAITAYCEKVALGCSMASMLKPDSDMYEFCVSEVRRIAAIYDVECYEWNGELWLFRLNHWHSVKHVLSHEVDSPQWHQSRARLFGIPEKEIDPYYHLRKGHGEKEKVTSSSNDE